MDPLWVLLTTGVVMVVYLIVLVRASIRGKPWAIDALKATSCLVEGPGAAPVWLRLEQCGPGLEREQELESAMAPQSELVA